jgi:hypothetical protein
LKKLKIKGLVACVDEYMDYLKLSDVDRYANVAYFEKIFKNILEQ